MDVFKATGYRPREGRCCGGCGPEFDADAIVVANTQAEALGLLLESYPESIARDWSLELVDVNKPGVIEH